MAEVVTSAKPRSKGLRRFSNFIVRNYLNLFSLGLLLAAMFYFVQVQQLRYATLSNNPELFSDGDMAVVTRVIDGDELRIRNARGSTLVRVLGIKSFDATERDLMLAEYGKVAVDYLEAEAVGKKMLVKLAEKKVDDEGRLLATLFTGEQQDQNLAESMLVNGLTLVYTKYPVCIDGRVSKSPGRRAGQQDWIVAEPACQRAIGIHVKPLESGTSRSLVYSFNFFATRRLPCCINGMDKLRFCSLRCCSIQQPATCILSFPITPISRGRIRFGGRSSP